MQDYTGEGRCVLWDTETTGLDADDDRIVEIAAIEVVDLLPTGRTFHSYVNPEREVRQEAFRIHGISSRFLMDKPLFQDVADAFLGFVGDDPMVAHNSPFDQGFLGAELARMGRSPVTNIHVDTLVMARQRLPPGAGLTLDSLCRRFKVDLSQRTSHNAILDCRLLAEVFIALNGGRHRSLDLGTPAVQAGDHGTPPTVALRPFRPSRGMGGPSPRELEAHARFVSGIKGSTWTQEDQHRPGM